MVFSHKIFQFKALCCDFVLKQKGSTPHRGAFELPETKSGVYSYFATLIGLESKQYRLIWLLEDGAIYIGVVNAFRDRKKG